MFLEQLVQKPGAPKHIYAEKVFLKLSDVIGQDNNMRVESYGYFDWLRAAYLRVFSS